MILKIFTIFDKKAHAYLPPFFLPNQELAIRQFKDCANDENHAFGRNPEDYLLCQIGEFNDEDAVISIDSKSESISALQLLQAPQQLKEVSE